MLPSLTRCHQSISNSLIMGSDAGTFASKLAYSTADSRSFYKIYVVAVTRYTNSRSSSFSTSIGSSSPLMPHFSKQISSSSPLMPHFSKQFLIVELDTSFHASCIHRIATSTSTPLTICVFYASSWILASTYFTSLFR